uniref:Uncharacterized protein n=1 Tax=Arundo donax TaxID=35708 RepID=A0A0A8YFI5_ARUDO
MNKGSHTDWFRDTSINNSGRQMNAYMVLSGFLFFYLL